MDDLTSLLLLRAGVDDLTADPLLSFDPEDLLTEVLPCDGAAAPAELLLCPVEGVAETLLLVDLVVPAASLDDPVLLPALVFPVDLLVVDDERAAVPEVVSVLLEPEVVVTVEALLREPEVLRFELRPECVEA